MTFFPETAVLISVKFHMQPPDSGNKGTKVTVLLLLLLCFIEIHT